MKIIEGFEKAKSAFGGLSRQGASQRPLEADDRERVVREIIDNVRRRGDAALIEYTEKFDGVKLTSLEVPAEQIKAAYSQVADGLLAALKLAAERITTYHTAQKEALVKDSVSGGTGLFAGALAQAGWLVRPLDRIGINAPGFRAPLPSSILMTAIPAEVAGVKEIIVVTPPGRRGTISPVTLVAADIAGVSRVFSIGGAQAVAALAFGTESVPAVDKICGPGNIYVTLAKKLLYGVVGIDGLFGTSELLIIADEKANPVFCAADLLAQAEHDPLVAPILVTFSKDFASKVIAETERQLGELPKPDLARQSLEERGIVAVVSNMDEAIELANLYAPEHLLLMVEKADSYIDRITNAGCIVTGEKATVALGDYIAGPSHVLPTGGTARFGSPLNVTDFVKLTSLIKVDDAILKKLGPPAQTLAEAEGLDAHAKAVEKRLTENSQ